MLSVTMLSVTKHMLEPKGTGHIDRKAPEVLKKSEGKLKVGDKLNYVQDLDLFLPFLQN